MVRTTITVDIPDSGEGQESRSPFMISEEPLRQAGARSERADQMKKNRSVNDEGDL